MIRLTEKGKQLYEATKEIGQFELSIIKQIAELKDIRVSNHIWNLNTETIRDLQAKGLIEGE